VNDVEVPSQSKGDRPLPKLLPITRIFQVTFGRTLSLSPSLSGTELNKTMKRKAGHSSPHSRGSGSSNGREKEGPGPAAAAAAVPIEKTAEGPPPRLEAYLERLAGRYLPATVLGISIPEVVATFASRVPVLITLLMFQSLSSTILQEYEDLIQRHTVITLFLTMLVGSGGNAGNQATVKILTGLASKEYSLANAPQVIAKESLVGVALAFTIFVIGAVRVVLFYDASDGQETLLEATVAISICLFFIVLSSVTIGALLPFLFLRVGIDPNHAGPTIQVIMDIMGVLTTCLVCSALLP